MDNTTQNNDIFDGSQMSPQFAIALRKFIMANPPASVRGSSHITGAQTIATGTNTKIIMTNDFAYGITWDGTNNRFVVKVAGTYLIAGLVAFSAADGNQYESQIYKNGASIANVFVHASDSGFLLSAPIMKVTDLAVGDYIELYAWQATGGNVTVVSDPAESYFGVTLQ